MPNRKVARGKLIAYVNSHDVFKPKVPITPAFNNQWLLKNKVLWRMEISRESKIFSSLPTVTRIFARDKMPSLTDVCLHSFSCPFSGEERKKKIPNSLTLSQLHSCQLACPQQHAHTYRPQVFSWRLSELYAHAPFIRGL